MLLGHFVEGFMNLPSVEEMMKDYKKDVKEERQVEERVNLLTISNGGLKEVFGSFS